MTTITTELAQRIAAIKNTIEDAAKLYGETWDSALIGSDDGNHHGIISEKLEKVVVRAEDDSRDSSWLCDYLEAVCPANVQPLLDRIVELEELATDYGMKFQRAQDALKHASIMNRGEARTEQPPLSLPPDVRAFIVEGLRDAVSHGEVTEVDYQFAATLEKLLGTIYTAPPAPAQPVEFLPENLDRALTVLGVALPVSKEEFNLEAERWMQRLINRVIRLDSELIPPAPAPFAVKLPEECAWKPPSRQPVVYLAEVKAMLTAAGIKIAEGE